MPDNDKRTGSGTHTRRPSLNGGVPTPTTRPRNGVGPKLGSGITQARANLDDFAFRADGAEESARPAVISGGGPGKEIADRISDKVAQSRAAEREAISSSSPPVGRRPVSPGKSKPIAPPPSVEAAAGPDAGSTAVPGNADGDLADPLPEESPKPHADAKSVIARATSGLLGSSALTSPRMAVPVRHSSDVPPGYQRITPPSRCVPYDCDDLVVRPLRLENLVAVAAAMKDRSDTALLDALAPCIVQDIRDLTEPDYKFFMYWLRINSFPRSPFKHQWISRYGNDNISVVNKENLHFDELKMTKAEYDKYRNMGIRFPTVRDAEAIRNANLGEDDAARMFLLERAQYVHLDEELYGAEFFDRRIQAMHEHPMGLEFLEHIREFAALIPHGVREVIPDQVDAKYEPKSAMEYLRRAAEGLIAFKDNNLTTASPEQIEVLTKRAQDYADEADEIETKLANGETPTPRKEEVPVQFRVIDFFSAV